MLDFNKLLIFLPTNSPNFIEILSEQTDISEEEAYQAARLTGLNLIATLKNHIGDLDRFKKMIKALGMVNCEPDFGAQPKVINGFADLMVEIFGDAGRGARSAVGMGSLPAGIPVEIEMIVEIK